MTHYSQLVQELDEWEQKDGDKGAAAVPHYKKTSLAPSIGIFDKFLNELAKENTYLKLKRKGNFF